MGTGGIAMTYPGRFVDDQPTLVNFDRIEANQGALRDQFATAQPFRHVVIDDFAEPVGLAALLAEMPDPHEAGIGKSRDYVFAKNKFEKSGFATYWLAQTGLVDALSVLALAGPRTSSIELGTAVVPTWTRHPQTAASQALTTQAATGGRTILGLGLAHKPSVEGNLRM